MQILVLGGTKFAGRAIVEAALGRGDAVTLFNRGKTNPDLYPGVETVIGDRTDVNFYRQVTRALGVLEYLYQPLMRDMVARYFGPLLLHGTADKMVPSAHGEWLAAHCPAADLRLVPDAGHITVLDEAPAALEWIGERAAATPR